MSHTPGPWEVARPYEAGLWIVGSLVEQIALLPFPDRTVTQSNARLIAAAPDMKAALLAVLAERETGARLNCWEQIEAAVAKADGK